MTPKSHTVLSFSRKQNFEYINKFHIIWNGSSFQMNTFFNPALFRKFVVIESNVPKVTVKIFTISHWQFFSYGLNIDIIYQHKMNLRNFLIMLIMNSSIRSKKRKKKVSTFVITTISYFAPKCSIQLVYIIHNHWQIRISKTTQA